MKIIFSDKKKVRILAAVVTIFMFLFVLCNNQLYFDSSVELEARIALFVVSLLTAPLAGFLIVTKFEWKEKWNTFGNTLLFFLMPIVTMQMVECLNSKFIYDFSVPTFFMNYLTYTVLYLIFYLITGRYHMVGLIVNISAYVFALLNYFVDLFRGSPFIPMDVLSFGTGLSVADGYTYDFSWQLLLGSIFMFLAYLANKKVNNVKIKKMRRKVLIKVVNGGFLAFILITFFFTDYTANIGYKPDFWNQSRGYHKTGSLFNFCLNTKYLHVSKPANYDAADTQTILTDALAAYGVSADSTTSTDILTGENTYTPSTSGETPNIICIMNESLSDLGLMGDLETNEDYMPFMHSLTENTIKGNLYMPVFGAGTSNSEFEFLTGNSISNLPAGCNVYQSYIKTNQSSLVSTLESQGYSSLAYHPYYGDGWNRPAVYNFFGFNKFVSIENFIDNDILNTYKQNNDAEEYADLLDAKYPGKNMLLRRFVSDSYDYQMVEDFYEQRDTSQPFFTFNVTMQNHGGYAMSYSNFVQEIYATNMIGSFPMANRYLSLVKESDNAFKEIVEYFSKVKEPTIICMFGDHQPSIEDSFYEKLLGTSLNNLSKEQEQSRYVTPFIIWANYDIDEATIDKMSSNYLSTLLLQTAGLELTDYNKYLATLYQTLPVIDSVGYIDSGNNYYSHGEASDYSDILNVYSRIQYNALIDTNNKEDKLFYLGDETTTK